ncbi:MAG TPA: thioredoxin family protein [Bacteroidales bacterium]|nr:thioredoxin family protein [Bacteroidales bacterium]
MKKNFFIIMFFLGGLGILSGQETCQRVFDEKSQTDILFGTCSREALLSCAFAEDYTIEYQSYQPNDTVLGRLKQLVSGVKCVIVLGTWCGDSKEQVPRFLKIIDQTGKSFDKLEIVCVDRKKEAPGTDVKTIYSIEKVPTFIFYRNDTEAGRIIETPRVTLEKDMLEIISLK